MHAVLITDCMGKMFVWPRGRHVCTTSEASKAALSQKRMLALSKNPCVYICIYIYGLYSYICVYVYIHIHLWRYAYIHYSLSFAASANSTII